MASAACTLKVGVWGTTAVMGATETGELITMAGDTPVYATGCFTGVTKLLLGNVIAATSISAGLYGITLASGATLLKDAGAESEAFNYSEPTRYMLWAAYSDTTLTAGGADDRLVSVLQG